ncbi:MAG: tail fiber domain-containing protein [Bacteroidota bacterium]
MKKIITLLIIACGMSSIYAQVGINTDNAAPDSSAMLDVRSTSQGFLYPRMTTAQRDAISNPAIGLTIFNLDNQCSNTYDGFQWLQNCGLVFSNGTLPPPDFSQIPDLPAAFQGRESAVAFTLGNKAYIGAGFDGANHLKDFWEFDGTSWNPLPALPSSFQPRRNAVAFTLGNKAYVGTGFDGANYLNDFWEFDGTNWNPAPFPSTTFIPRFRAVAFTLGNKAYVGTGVNGANYLKDFWEFDGTSWSPTNALPANFQTREGAVAFILGNKAYVGTGANQDLLRDFWAFDGSSWDQLPELPLEFPTGFFFERYRAVAFTLGNKAFVGTGFDAQLSESNNFWTFNGSGWDAVPNIPPDFLGRDYAVAFSLNNQAYVGTGARLNSYLKDFWAFNPSNFVQYVNSDGEVSWVNSESNTQDLTLNLSSNILSLNGDATSVDLGQYEQDISLDLSTNSLSLSGDDTAVDLSPYAQDLSQINDTLRLSGSISTVDLNPYINNWETANGNVYRNSGNVGIGTNTPNSALEVNGNIAISNANLPMGLATEAPNPATPILNLSVNTLLPGSQTNAIGGIFRIDSRNTNNAPLFQWLRKPIGQLSPLFQDILMSLDSSGNLGIGTATPNSSAKLEVSSTDAGFLPPRMTSAQRAAITNPATGLLVYQTDTPKGLFEYDGTQWTLVGSNLSNGNLTTDAPTNGSGVLDANQPLSNGAFPTLETGEWQSFTAEHTGLLKEVEIEFSSLAAPPSGPTIRIYAGEGTNGLLLTSETFPAANVTGLFRIAFSNPVSVSAGQKYTLWIADGSAAWSTQDPGPYAGGRPGFPVGGGIGLNYDFQFRTFVQPIPFLLLSADPVSGDLGIANDRIYISDNGNVGIGTLSPTRAKLEVSGFTTSNVGSYGFLSPAGNTGAASGPANYSIYADSRIAAFEFNAFSDARIKSILGISNSQDDLATLMDIQITDYQHIDTIQQGTDTHKKVIAQQVAEVFPQAVTTTTTEVIPDIYQRASLRDGWIELATDLQVGDRVKIITETSNDIHEVIAVEDSRFQVDNLDIRSAEGDGQYLVPGTSYPVPFTLFVYGREVHDFHTVDYEAIAMLNVSATQQLARDNEALRERINQLEQQLQRYGELSQRLTALEAAVQTSISTEK